MGGEPVVEWASLVRTWFNGRPVVTFGYTQEVPGYLPVDELLDEGGYEVVSSNHFRTGNPAPFAPVSTRRFVAAWGHCYATSKVRRVATPVPMIDHRSSIISHPLSTNRSLPPSPGQVRSRL